MTDIALQNDAPNAASAAAILRRLGRRSIVLVGMMGVGKSSVGRRLAARLGMPVRRRRRRNRKGRRHEHRRHFRPPRRSRFPQRRGARDRAAARRRPAGAGDRRRRLHESRTRAQAIKAKGVSIWLNADLDVLMRRINKRRNERPLLQTADPARHAARLAGRARADLCAGRPHRAVARRAARRHRGRHHGRAGRVPERSAPPQRKAGA